MSLIEVLGPGELSVKLGFVKTGYGVCETTNIFLPFEQQSHQALLQHDLSLNYVELQSTKLIQIWIFRGLIIVG